MKNIARVTVFICIYIAGGVSLLSCGGGVVDTAESNQVIVQSPGQEQQTSSNNKPSPIRNVLIAGRISFHAVPNFGNCPQTVIVNIISHNAERNKKAYRYQKYGDAVKRIMNFPANTIISFENDGELFGFQTEVDENGFFHVCDEILPNDREKLSYEVEEYVYIDNCDKNNLGLNYRGQGITVNTIPDNGQGTVTVLIESMVKIVKENEKNKIIVDSSSNTRRAIHEYIDNISCQ